MRHLLLLAPWEQPTRLGELTAAGCCKGALPPSQIPVRGGGMLNRGVREGKEHVSGHLPKTNFICFEDVSSLFY